MTERLHEDELAIDDALVRSLLGRALPSSANQPLKRLPATGSTNALYRLGTDLLVRLPRQPGGSATIEKEARWTPWIAPRLPVRVPEVVVVGEPGFGYPERWSVTRWLAGETLTAASAAAMTSAQRTQLARDLARTVLALREMPVPQGAADEAELWWYRAGPLADITDDTARNIALCRQLNIELDLDAAERVWAAAMALPDTGERPQHWLHGDLLGENLLVRDGRLRAVLDLGGLAVGDPTVDLVCAWELLDEPARAVFRELVDVTDDVWLRGRAWALALSVMTFPYYGATMPERCADRVAMGRAAIAGP
jgi:aminoglycoside phosphotransferase (APT) family kinase protein